MAKDPCRFFYDFVMNDIVERKEKMLLTLSYCDESDDKNDHKVYSLNAALDNIEGPETEKDKLNLRLIFALLHSPIMTPHLEHTKKESLESQLRMTGDQFASYCLEEDKSYLLQIVYALTMGHTQLDPTKLELPQCKNDKSDFLAICVAKQLMERANTNRPGPLQAMMGDTLQQLNVPKNVVQFLSLFRISEAKTTTDRKLILRSLNQSMSRINIGPLDAFCLHLDNFGFKGWRGKWSQHTVIQVSIIKKEKLKQLGFYSDGELDRSRKEIEDLLQECDNNDLKVAKQIVEPKKEDYMILTNRVLKTIQSAIAYDLPSPNESREFLLTPDISWGKRFPSNFGVDLPRGGLASYKDSDESTNIKNLFHNKDLVNDDMSRTPTYYERNNIELDNVMNGDPNANLVVEKIMKHLEKVSGVNEIDYNRTESGNEEPVRFIISPATADGAPVKRSLDLIASDIAKNGFEDRSYKLAKIFLSGFHFQMEFLTMRGRLFRDLFSFFGRKWRQSDPALNWILTIRDPREALKEYRDYLLAHYRAAADASGSDNPVEVHQHMLARAVEIPTCMATLLDLRILQIVFMIQDAEKSGDCGDVSLFLTTMRFALSLFCITHAVNYCHLVAEFLEWHELASPAEKVLFKEFYYTKLSPHGKPIWVDRGVEWTVRHIRSCLGHRMRPKSHDTIVGRVVTDIPFRVKAKRDIRYLIGEELQENYTSEQWNDQTFSIGPAFHATRVALEDTNFWGHGPLQGELECSSQDSAIFVDIRHDGENEALISASVLGGFDLGIKRAIAYYREHHINQRYQKKRSEKNVKLKLLPTIHVTRNEDIETTKKIRVSCVVEELEPLTRDFPVSLILQELEYYKNFLFPEIEFRSNGVRKLLLQTLCKYREKYFRENPEVYASMIEGLDSLEVSDSHSTRETRENQIKAKIYQLDKEVMRAYHDSI